MTKKTSQKAKGITKYLLWVMLGAIIAPSNYTGQCINLRNRSNPLLANQNDLSKSPTEVPTPFHPPVLTPFLIFLLVSFIISTSLCILKLRFLNSPSFPKPCLLLFLHKDIAKISMAMNLVWMTSVLMRDYAESKHGIDNLQSKIISTIMLGMVLLFLVFLNTTATFKLYMMKKMMVDPPMPWGEDKDLGIMIIRIISGVMVLGVVSTMTALEMHPKIYYTYVGYPESHIALPDILFATLFITFTGISLASKYYQSTNQDNIDTGIPRQVNYTMWMILTIFAVGFFAEMFDAFDIKNRWKLYQILIATGSVIIPLIVILQTDQLKSYVKKIIQNKLHDMLYLNVKFVIMCLCVYVLMACV